MTLLYQRAAAVEVARGDLDGRRLTGLRLAFRARRSSTVAADAAEVTVYNAAPATLGVLAEPDAVARVLAGYGDVLAQVIGGAVVRGSLRVAWRGPDRVATWQVHDGGLELRDATVARAWAGAVTAGEVIEALRSDVGLARGAMRLGYTASYVRGYVAYGSLRDTLDSVCGDTGSRWAVQDGVLHVWPMGSARSEVAVLLSPSTGLLGSPARTDGGVEASCLLRPEIRPGSVVRLQGTREHGGDYVVSDVEHVGDTHGQDWRTTWVGRPRGG